jgi:hypothetical protein
MNEQGYINASHLVTPAESKKRSPKNDAHENFTKEEQIYKVFQQTERKYDVQFRWKFAARK